MTTNVARVVEVAVLTLQREEVELLDRLERALDADPAQVPDLSGQIRAKRRELTSLQALVDELGAGR